MKIKIKVPELSDIKLSWYQKFLRTTKDRDDETFIQRQMVGIFCDLPDNVVNSMTKRSFDSVVSDLTKILKDLDKQPLKRIIKHEGVEYGFIPNLDNITVGEQADLSEYIGDWQKMDKALGVMYRPLTLKRKEAYLIEEYKGEGQSLDLPLGVTLGAYFFFVNLAKDLLSCTPNFIVDQVKADKNSLTLVENGVGINQFTESLKEIFLSLRMSLS